MFRTPAFQTKRGWAPQNRPPFAQKTADSGTKKHKKSPFSAEKSVKTTPVCENPRLIYTVLVVTFDMQITDLKLKKRQKGVKQMPETTKPLESSLANATEEKLEHMLEMKKAEQAAAAKAPVVPPVWNLSERGKQVVSKAVELNRTEFGLYASIPMVCKGEDCVYAELYPELHDGLSESGERCPVEVAMILTRYEAYSQELKIKPTDAVDLSILRDVIDCDIQIIRAENKMALEGDFVKDVTVGVNEAGVPVTQEQISQAAQYKDKIQAKRMTALKLLNATRKDKAGERMNGLMDPSSYAMSILKGLQNQPIEGEFEELEIVEDVPYMQAIKEKENTQTDT